jgi:hypothetical protein
MKKQIYFPAIIFILSFFLFVPAIAQKPIASPRDSVNGKIGKANISINYGSPSVKGRKIWGDLVPYSKVWRAGANEATTFTTDQAITVEGKALPAGKYGFFVIPGETEWTIIFNKTPKQWGAYEYKEKDDALRVTVKSKASGAMNERLIYKINTNGISLLWENLEVPVSIK